MNHRDINGYLITMSPGSADGFEAPNSRIEVFLGTKPAVSPSVGKRLNYAWGL